MTATSFRSFLRWFHIGIALFLGAYFYSPLSAVSWSLPFIKFVLIPLLVLSGISLWKQAKLMKLFKKQHKKK